MHAVYERHDTSILTNLGRKNFFRLDILSNVMTAHTETCKTNMNVAS